MDNELLGKIFSASAGVWAIFLAVTAAIFKAWPHIMGRSNERKRDLEAAEAADWDRLRAENVRCHEMLNVRETLLSTRDQRISELLEEKAVLLARAVTAESTILGMGIAKQEAAAIVAAERLTDAVKKHNGEEGK